MLNQSIIVGRLVNDPELRETENGYKVTNESSSHLFSSSIL